jgi:hypothetical protein
MKSLTKTQQEIVNSIVKEFEKFNTPTKESNPNDLIAFINNALNEKQGFIDEIKITNKAYDKANENKVLEYVNQMNAILNVFGYECEIKYIARSRGNGRDYAEYFKVRIIWRGHFDDRYTSDEQYTDVYFHVYECWKESTWHLLNSSLKICKDYTSKNTLDSLDDLLKYVAEMIIAKQKSLIK